MIWLPQKSFFQKKVELSHMHKFGNSQVAINRTFRNFKAAVMLQRRELNWKRRVVEQQISFHIEVYNTVQSKN